MYTCITHTTGDEIGDFGAESISRALQSNTSLKSLDISGVLFCSSTHFTQQVTVLVILVLRTLQEHSNQTLHSHHLIFPVCRLVQPLSHRTVNEIRYSGVEHIGKALQSNTSLKSLAIARALLYSTQLTRQLTILESLVLRAFLLHSNQTLHSTHLLSPVCRFA